MKNRIIWKISIIILVAVSSRIFNLSCFEGNKEDSGSKAWSLMSMVQMMSGYIRINNESSYEIDMVYIFPMTSDSVGNDLLSGIIFNGEYDSFAKIEGVYHVIIVDSRYTGGWEFTNVPVTAGETSSITCTD